MAFFARPDTSSRPRVVLALAWLSALLWILPTSAHGQGVCDRTPQVRDKLVEVTGASGCEGVTSAHLASIRELDLSESEITELQEHDFGGLNSLYWLRLNDNSLTELPQGVFSGLSSLGNLWLHDNDLTALPENVFGGLVRLHRLTLFANSLEAVPERIFRGLNSLRNLSLGNNALTTLPEEIFSGLSNLQDLSLINNTLTSLPEGVFRGLSALRTLRLESNDLTALPARIFRSLNSLEQLGLINNSLTSLPAGIFDDILDTLGPETGVFGDLTVDPHLKATIAFASKQQTGLRGTTVRAKVTLSRPLPVAVRAPYSLEGGAAEDDHADLSPDPESGLLFLAGEMSKEIQLRLPMNNDGAVKTIVLTLGKLSQIGLRRSDGTGPDAPFLKSETLLGRPEDHAVHTVTIASSSASAEVCNRTPQVRDNLTEAAGVSSCVQLTLRHLAGLTRLDLSGTGIYQARTGRLQWSEQSASTVIEQQYPERLASGGIQRVAQTGDIVVAGQPLERVARGNFRRPRRYVGRPARRSPVESWTPLSSDGTEHGRRCIREGESVVESCAAPGRASALHREWHGFGE